MAIDLAEQSTSPNTDLLSTGLPGHSKPLLYLLCNTGLFPCVHFLHFLLLFLLNCPDFIHNFPFYIFVIIISISNRVHRYICQPASFQWFSELSEDGGVELESEDELGSSRSSLERQGHRANTTVHVCWHRNTSVSMVDFSVAVEVLSTSSPPTGLCSLQAIQPRFCPVYLYDRHLLQWFPGTKLAVSPANEPQ